MAETETHSEITEDTFKGAAKTKALNGHPDIAVEEEDCGEKSDCSDKMENGETDCKSPQLNGDISDKSALDTNCGLPKDDNICIEDSSDKVVNKDITPENGKTNTTGDHSDSDVRSYDNHSDADISDEKSVVSEDKTDKSYVCTKGETSDCEDSSKSSSKDIDKSKDVSDNNEVVPVVSESESRQDKSPENEDEGSKGSVDCTNEEEISSDSENNSAKNKNEPKDDEETSDDKDKEESDTAVLDEQKDVKGDKKSDNKEKTTTPKKEVTKPEIVKRVTRSSSGVSKPVKYVDPDPKSISDEDDDDDIKITKEVKKDEEESDIEMIEESDPLAISDADVKKAKEANKTVPVIQDRLKNYKPREAVVKGKDQSNVIIIDTNTLLKGQNSSITAHPSVGKITTGSVSTSAQTTASGNTPSTNIQTAIQAITGGNPAIQGLQSAYLNAIQQVLVAQGGSQVSNPHYIATLQQYYNTLGALQDDAYVIEAPSFIVPYVMEGKPVETIKDYLTKINKELEELEKKREEEELRKKKEEEELRKKEEEEAAAAAAAAAAKEKEKDKEEEKEEGEEEAEAKETEGEEAENKDKEVEKKEEGEGEQEEEEAKDKTSVEEEVSTTKEKAKSPAPKEKEAGAGPPPEGAPPPRDDDDKENKKEPSKPKEEDDDVIQIDGDTEKPKEDFSHLGRWEGYYRSALGKFFVDLGLSHVQEFIQSDLLRMQKRRVEKKTNPTKQDIISVKTLERQLNVSKQKNAHLHVPMKTCRFCNFKTETGLVMERHLESPHMVNYTYKCNFCDFETRGPQVILFHTEAEHNVRGRLERAPAFFQCPLCPFEDNNKSKMTRHSFSCTKKFKADKNSEMPDWEPPAKIPKIHRGRPNSFGKTFDALKMPNILPKNLGGLSLNLHNAISSGLLGSAGSAGAAGLNSMAGRGRGRPVGSYKNITQPIGARPGSLMYQNRGSNLLPMQGVTSAQQLSIANQVLQSVTHGSSRVPRILPASSAGSLIPGLAASSSITIQSVQNKSGTSKSPQQPSISITPLPRGGGNQSGNKTTPTNPTSNNSQRPAFVICEICDGYIKDLEQLRNHMNLIHKVKIHPKMIYNRPPLNCQKCQHRFFTDQGLERHLLGTHGLVTSSMQEAANKGKDAGRCPICGKVFQWKLLNHVSRDHKMTLKPAHLSYKCTVCTATFNMYRLFENHVYSAHSVVNKNKANETTNNATSVPPKKPPAGNEAPLKINDEITIIPQPASKSPKSEVKASPKKSDSPSMSKEITITKVGSRTSSRRSGNGSGSSSSSSSNSSTSSNGSSSSSNPPTGGGGGGGGVEVISLDDSPQKRQATSAPTDEPPSKKRTRETATSKRARTST